MNCASDIVVAPHWLVLPLGGLGAWVPAQQAEEQLAKEGHPYSCGVARHRQAARFSSWEAARAGWNCQGAPAAQGGWRQNPLQP